MAKGLNLKEAFSKPRTQWLVVALMVLILLIVLIAIMSKVSSKPNSTPSGLPTRVTIEPNRTLEYILSATAFATQNYHAMPATWTQTSTATFVPTFTATLTPTGTNTFLPTFTGTITRTRTPLRTNTTFIIRTNTRTPTRTATRTATGSTPTRTSTLTSTLTSTSTSSPTSTSTLTSTLTSTSTLTETPTVTFTFTPTVTSTPRPDRIAFSVDTNADGMLDIVTTDITGGDQDIINRGVDMFFWDWAPDGQFMVYDSNGTLYLIRPDGTWNMAIPGQPANYNYEAAWSPDGQWIVFVSDAGMGDTDLYIIHPNGTGLTQLTTDGATTTEYTPDWAPNSTTVVYATTADANIYAVDSASPGSPSVFITLPGGTTAFPHFSPDGNFIIFAYDDGVSGMGWDIWLALGDGSGPMVWPNPGINDANTQFYPNWGRIIPDIIYLSDQTVPGTFEIYISSIEVANGWSDEASPNWMP